MLTVLAVAVSSCGDEGERPRLAKGKVGDTLTAVAGSGDKTLKLEIRLVAFSRDARPTNEDLASTAFAGTRKDSREYNWARLKVRLRSLGPETGPISGESFVAIDARDQRYKGVDLDPGGVFEPDATGQTLEVGDRLQGFVAIPVPKRARIVAVRYSSVSGGSSAEWRLAPSQDERPPRGAPVPRWPAGEQAYTVVVMETASRQDAEDAARLLVQEGVDAGVLGPDDYSNSSSLPRGRWIVWRGRYRSPGKAQEALNFARQRGTAGFVAYVVPRNR